MKVTDTPKEQFTQVSLIRRGGVSSKVLFSLWIFNNGRQWCVSVQMGVI